MTKLKVLQAGKTYILYGKMGSMKRFRPVSNSDFCVNLIHAEMYTPKNTDELRKMNRELEYLNTQGIFEYRLVR